MIYGAGDSGNWELIIKKGKEDVFGVVELAGLPGSAGRAPNLLEQTSAILCQGLVTQQFATGRRSMSEDVDHEPLADFGFVVHNAMAGVDQKALDEDNVTHRLFSIAEATRKACTVSATS